MKAFFDRPLFTGSAAVAALLILIAMLAGEGCKVMTGRLHAQ
ncbi:hypothetical protein [Methylomonas rosea]|uniref:Uncharacterized protein n=1 Tax=Methylomonas rosea TaxID=2952227 RepID=A0ABT1TQ23_9GAMM|nr:hypothetical protein [Methylomonas sp. WSC-7]MCQ8116133.1 hypothetical protein [Methylomonas sp. WSC-7]